MKVRKSPHVFFYVAIACAFSLFPAFAGNSPTVTLPEPSEGNVDGWQGISFWPSLVIDGEDRPVNPSGCSVYLVPSNVNERLTHPCGQWFAPPADRYTVWLEQGDHISAQTVINSAGVKFSDNGVVVLIPMNDAGFVAIPSDIAIGDQKTVRLLSIEPSAVGFEKRLQAAEAHSTHRLPAGRAIAGIFDGDGKTIALSRPFAMKEGKTALVTPRVPESGTDLMLVLAKGRASPRDRAAGKTKINAIAGGKSLEPDVMYENNGRIVAIWYAIASKTATLALVSDVFRLDEREVRLTPGAVTTIREDLGINTKGVIR